MIKMNEFIMFINENYSFETIMQQRDLPVVRDNNQYITLIAGGGYIWIDNACAILSSFHTIYLQEYPALPTNIQLTERGAKESSYISLGRRGETNRSIMSISREKLIPKALKKGQTEITTKQLQGKKRTKVLMRELLVQQQKNQDKHGRDCNILKENQRD